MNTAPELPDIQCPRCGAHSPAIRSEDTRQIAQRWHDQHQLDCPKLWEFLR